MVKNLSVNSEKKITVDKRYVHSVVKALSKYLNFECADLEIIFVSEDYIFELNKEYLNHVNTTDIITFDYSESRDNLSGEIYISVDDGRKNAERFNCSFEVEILRLIIHGILHLLGYDDIEEHDKKVMKKLENELVNKYKYIITNNTNSIYDRKNN